MAELKPCPFCGGKAIELVNLTGDFYCICEQCKATTKMFGLHVTNDSIENAKEKATNAWNRRADDE